MVGLGGSLMMSGLVCDRLKKFRMYGVVVLVVMRLS